MFILSIMSHDLRSYFDFIYFDNTSNIFSEQETRAILRRSTFDYKHNNSSDTTTANFYASPSCKPRPTRNIRKTPLPSERQSLLRSSNRTSVIYEGAARWISGCHKHCDDVGREHDYFERCWVAKKRKAGELGRQVVFFEKYMMGIELFDSVWENLCNQVESRVFIWGSNFDEFFIQNGGNHFSLFLVIHHGG